MNQQIYQRLNASLNLNLRRQIFIAVCDDLILRDRLAAHLQTELNAPTATSSTASDSHAPYPRLVSLQLSLDDPNPLLQIAQWLTQSPPPIVEGEQIAIPAFQILGIEHLTRQSSATQRLFFTHLQTIEQNLPLLDFSVLLWMTQPWYHALPQSVPGFWQCRTGIFEFIGDPTSLTITLPEHFGVQSQQSIASALPPSHLERTLPSWVEETSQDTQTQQSGGRDRIGIDDLPRESLPEERPWIDLVGEIYFEETGADSGVSSGASSNASLPESSLVLNPEEQPIAIDALPPADAIAAEFWPSLFEDELQEDTEADGLLTQAEISLLLGEALPSSQFEAIHPVDAEHIAEATEATEVTEVSPAAAEITAPVPIEEAENPWLVLAEELTQPYELGESAISSEPIEASLQPQIATDSDQTFETPTAVPAPGADAGRSIPFIPIQLPEGLTDPKAVQSMLWQIEQLHQQQVAVGVLIEAYRNLGNLCRDRIEQGEVTPANLIVAIQAYEQVLLRLPDASPLWVDVLNDLGNLYWMASRTTPNATEALTCLNQAIQSYQFALTKIDPPTQAHAYPMVQNNLGAAYADLARHDNPTQHLELSVQAYQQALRWRTPETDPLRYASTQNNLGTTYWNLAQYKEAAKNLKLAIAAYADALQYYNPAEEPLNYAMIQNNLGTAYWNLAQHERSHDWLMSAVSAYRMALEYRTLEANPVAHAATQNNLGTAYWHIANETENAQARVDYLQEAIDAYETALQAVKYLQTHQPHTLPLLNFDLFATYNNLGLAYYQIATNALVSLDSNKQSHYLQSALDHHILAWQGWAQKANLRQTALSCIVQTIQASYNQLGLSGQSLALSKVPGELLPDILPRL